MDYMTLMGAEDVSRAGRNMSSAADTMSRAASSMDDSLRRHAQMMDEFLMRLSSILEEDRNARDR